MVQNITCFLALCLVTSTGGNMRCHNRDPAEEQERQEVQ